MTPNPENIYASTLLHFLTGPDFLGASFALAVLLLLRLAMKNKVGWGDVKLSALIGFLLGPWSWALAALAASASGIVFLCARHASGRGTLRQSVAFAPFLAGGAVASFFLSPVLSGLLGVR